MLTVTEQAKEELKRLLDASVGWPGARLRPVERQPGHLGLAVDIQGEDDQAVEYEGSAIVRTEPARGRNRNGQLIVRRG